MADIAQDRSACKPVEMEPSRCVFSWRDCPNAKRTIDAQGYHVMRCKLTGIHPDGCARGLAYRGYYIYPGNTVFAQWHYAHEDYDGPEDGRCGYGKTIEECKAEIDEVLDD